MDAAQGVEAQTLANTYLALDHHLEIIPVINKIDLPSAEIPRIKDQIENIIGLDAKDAILASAKEGVGTEEILEAIVHRLPPPKGDYDRPLKALIFDSWFDSYRGVIVLVRVIDGTLRKGQKIRMVNTQQVFTVEQVGVITPKLLEVDELSVGEVGYVIANIKRVADTKIGDTITEDARPTPEPFPGFQEVKPMVFAGLYPTNNADYEALRDALSKLQLNDSAFFYEPDTSGALGFGFRCGFLGLLHMEIVQERLEREFNLSLITTAPGVRYRITTQKGEVLEIHNPSKLPEPGEIAKFEEPMIKAMILTNDEYVGPILKLAEEKRGVQKGFEYITRNRVLITYELPLERDRSGFLRPDEIGFRGLCVSGLSFLRIPGIPAGPAGHPGGRRTGGCPLPDRSPGHGGNSRKSAGSKNEGADSPADVRSGHPGRNRQQDHRPGSGPRHAEECSGKVLRRRHHEKKKAAGKTEGRQKADEASGQSRNSAGSFPGNPKSGIRQIRMQIQGRMSGCRN